MGKLSKRLIIMQIAATIVMIAIYVGCMFNNDDNLHVVYYISVSVLLFFAVCSAIIIFALNVSKSAKENLFNQITVFVPGGYIECYYDDDLTIKYCSDKLMLYLGYSYAEFKAITKDKLINIIAPEDRAEVIRNYKENLGQKNAQMSFKLLCKGQRKVSVIAMYNYSKRYAASKKSITIQNFLIDPLSLSQMQMEKDIDAERYKIVAEQSESIIFDYFRVDGTIFLNSNFEKKFGYVIGDEKLFEKIERESLIYPEDKSKFYSLDVVNNPYNETEIRVKKADGEYIWCKIRMSTVYDKDKKAIRIIGKIIDVDASRKEKQQLIEKTKRDVMTGLYNKLVTEKLITEELEKAPQGSLFAFIFFDVDNFKQINDEYGHIRGDNVLSRISEEIRKMFRSSDIIGRIGGDEFVIFLKDLPNEEHALIKAQSVLSIISANFSGQNNGLNVSVSIGISFYNKDGTTYRELFEKADIALYASKKAGKKTYTVYDPSLEKRETLPQ